MSSGKLAPIRSHPLGPSSKRSAGPQADSPLCRHCASFFRRSHDNWELVPQIHDGQAIRILSDSRLGLEIHHSAQNGCQDILQLLYIPNVRLDIESDHP